MIRFSVVASFFVVSVTFVIVLGADSKLVLVNVVHRHGDRTPSKTETYPNDPYINHTYWPIGRGGLTNEGKSRLHHLGKMLRSMYGDFLGRTYTPEILVTRSSEFDRTKMSAQLVLSGLYPPDPVQQWNGQLLWQPIPTVYSPLFDDILLLPYLCSIDYITEYEKILATAEMQKKIAQFGGLMATLGKHTGQNITNTMDLFYLYITFSAQLAANLTLQDWVKEFYPNGELLKATVFHYQLISYNDNLKRTFGGTLLRKITDDVASYAKGTLEKGRKLFQYSAHDMNIAGLQSTLGVYEPHVPAFVSAVIIEIWQHDDDLFVKVLYFAGIPAKLTTQKIPGCEELCPFHKFLELLKPVIAKDSDYSLIVTTKDCKHYTIAWTTNTLLLPLTQIPILLFSWFVSRVDIIDPMEFRNTFISSIKDVEIIDHWLAPGELDHYLLLHENLA